MRNEADALHRKQLLVASFPSTAFAVIAATAIYAIVDLSNAPGTFDQKLVPDVLQLLVPLVALLLVRRSLPGRPEEVILAADLLFTAIMASRLMLPSTSASGTALLLALKMVATAVLFPWRPAFQVASVTSSLALYCSAMALAGRLPLAVHELWGPLIAAGLSVLGATRTDSTRLALFRHNLLLAESERRLRSLWTMERTLVEVAREISAVTELPKLLERINKLTASALGCEFSAMFLLDEERAEMVPGAVHAAPGRIGQWLRRFHHSVESPLVRELLAGETVVINDPTAQTWLPEDDLLGHEIERIAFVPLTMNGRGLGVLTAGRTQPSEPFDDRQITLLNGVAAQAAVAIHNAQLFDRVTTSESRYRDLFDGANDLIFVVAEEGSFHFANQAALDFVGSNAEDLSSITWDQFLSEASRSQMSRRLRLAKHRNFDSRRTFEVTVRRPRERRATLELRARLISRVGDTRVYQCIARDITQRKQQELETGRLLRQLKESNRLQTEFAANISHELRTPLNVIIGYADLLADDPEIPIEGEARSFVKRITSAARGLHRLVESLLEYARLDRGRTNLIASAFSANHLILELKSLCNDVQSSTDVSVRFDATSDLQFATDYDRLYTVLSNLLLNALKFTPRGTIVVQLEAVEGAAEFLIRDSGIGIPAQELKHVFAPFRQADGSATRSFGGVGLGLAIVRRNVELLGGRIEVESIVGSGTTFTLRVPLALPVPGESERNSSAA